jgi:EpsI family protein
MEKPGVRQLVYFWFPMRGRVLTTLYGVKIANFWDTMTKQRIDGALIRVITPVYQNETMAEAEGRRQSLRGKSYPSWINIFRNDR